MVDHIGDEDDGSEEEASGDDYKEEQHSDLVVRRGRGTKRITSSDEEDINDDDEVPSPRASARRTQLKRKRRESNVVQRKRPRKPSSEIATDDDPDRDERQRKKSSNKTKGKHDSVLDPTRKYCLGKLRDVLLPIFVQFANTPSTSSEERPEETSITELDEEQKKKAEEHGATYVQDLEQCLFEIYGEPDKHGDKTAVGKYKDRFRMLSFNLSQPDRHLLRRSIGMHTLPALQLAKMSSVDLANEQTKQQIEAANRESLEYSILTQRPIAARAKITHKGEEIIEDLEGDDIGRRIRDEEQRERDREREREKGARERAKMPPPPPPAPIQGPQDILAQQHNAASQKAAQAQAQRQPPILSSQTDTVSEPSFKFDDLIAIDLPDDSPPQDSTLADDAKLSDSTSPPVDSELNGPSSPTATLPGSATSPARPRSASFDLNHVWSGASGETLPQESSGSPILSARTDEPRDPPTIDIELGTGADDEDFDMFLDQAEAPATARLLSGAEGERAIFEALPVVWSGTLTLPDAGKSPAVEARQVGGRPIDLTSSQWQKLFPSHTPHHLKVDGRVPVKDSAKYMTQNRMNVTRELIIVALTPTTGRTDYDEIISFLINRDRHAVVHPWGPNPGPEAPGKELYLIPIMPDEALPDYVEILDLVKFPKQRDDKMLLGVFILNKGKFSERIHQTYPQPLSNISRTEILPSVAHGNPTQPSGPPINSSAPQPIPDIPPEIVSKLTTEQIESLLQTVLAGGLNPLPMTQPQQAAPPMATYPSTFPSLTNLLPQSYPTAPYPPYPHTGVQPSPQFTPPPPPPQQQAPHVPYNYSPPHMPTSPPRNQDYRGPHGGAYNRSGRGDFDRPRGRGRHFNGNDRGRGTHDFDRPRDSGWGGRGRGRGAHQQNQSPPRRW
ncbi:hypothetical protein K439DRAFT_1001449 [Ramaria rubella]|nr:hypothetical protein K439DRAFT_1001449 [Ramaria rubella]